MKGKEKAERLPIWEDLDIDLERARQEGEKRAKSLAISPMEEAGGYYKRTKALYEDIVDNHEWR